MQRIFLLHSLRTVRFFGAVLAVLTTTPLALAADATSAGPTPKHYQIASGEATVTLKQFTAQWGGQIVYLADTVRGVRTNAVEGDLPAREALDRMLAGTGLQAIEDQNTGAFTVKRAPPPLAR